MAQGLGAKYLPGLATTFGKGLGYSSDMMTFPIQYVLDVEDQESRDRWEGVGASAMHGIASTYAHTGSAILDNLGAVTETIGMGDPLESLADPLRRWGTKHAALLAESSQNHNLQQQVFSGAIQSIGLLGEFVAAAAIPGIGWGALPLIMANRASRDPETGRSMGAWETAKGAAIGTAMHGIFKGAGGLSTFKRIGATGAGMSALTAYEGGTNQDIAAAGFLGAGMAALGGPQGRKRDLLRETSERDFLSKPMLDRLYDYHGQDHSLLNGLKKAEARMERAEQPGLGLVPEDGVPRWSEADFAPTRPSFTGKKYVEAKGPQIPDEGFPATALPGEPATAWQALKIQEAMERGENPRFYDTGQRINLNRHFLPGQLRNAAVEFIEQGGGAARFYGIQEGTVKWDTTLRRAQITAGERLGETEKQTLARVKEGRGYTPSELAAIDMVFQARGERLDIALGKVQRGDKGAREEFTLALTEWGATMQEMSAADSNAGRALNILKSGTTLKKRQAMAEWIEQMGGKGTVDDLATIVGNLSNEKALHNTIAQAMRATERGGMKRAVDYWKAGLLSGFSTHTTNINSTVAHIALNYLVEQPVQVAYGLAKIPIQRGITAAISANRMRGLKSTEHASLEKYFTEYQKTQRAQVEKDFPSLDPTKRLYAEDALQALDGLIESREFAADALVKSWQTGNEFLPKGSSRKSGSQYDAELGRSKSLIPFRALTAVDAFMGAASYHAELRMLGGIEAREMGVPLMQRRDVSRQFVHEVHNPVKGTPNKRLGVLSSAQSKALMRSDELKFTNPLGEIGNRLIGFKNSHWLMEIIFPFVRTPINVSKQGLYRSPVGIIAPHNIADIRAGGKRQNEALSRLTSGALIGLAIYGKVLAGDITGATPTDEGERELQRSQGISPLSFRVTGHDGDSLMQSYARIEPLATPTALIATMIEERSKGNLTADDLGGALELIAGTIAEIIVNRSMLQSPKKIMEAVTSPEAKMQTYIESMVASVIPSLSNSLARGEDPYRRDQTGLPEAIWARLPGSTRTPELARKLGFGENVFREGLPVMHDLLGRPMTTGDPGHQSLARMFDDYQSPLTPDSLLDAMAISGAGIRRVSKMVTIRSKDMWAKADPDLTMLGNSLQKELHIEMTPTQREWVNGESNKAAATELRLIIPKLMSTPAINQEISLDALLGHGVPDDVVRKMRGAGVTKAAIIDAVRTIFRTTYSRHRKTYTEAVIDRWRTDGKLREEVEKQLKVEHYLQQYRTETYGGQQ